MTVYLGIDYGTKHVGLAVADGPLARPLVSLDSLAENDLIERLVKLIGENEIEKVVIGLPEGNLDAKVKEFTARLQKMTQLPVMLHPETLSTHDALVALRAVGAGKGKLKNDHVYAACLILEDYLATQD